MMKTLLRSLLAACLWLAAGTGHTAVEPPPAALFFADSAVRETHLSPSGRYLALTSSRPGARVGLYVYDLQGTTPPTQAARPRNRPRSPIA